MTGPFNRAGNKSNSSFNFATIKHIVTQNKLNVFV